MAVDYLIGDTVETDEWVAARITARIYPDGRGRLRLWGAPCGTDAVVYGKALRIVRRGGG